MFRWLAVLAIALLMMTAVVQKTAYINLDGAELVNFVFLPLVKRDLPLPVINQFRANVTVADPGDTVELIWDTTYAISVTIYHLLPSGQFGTFWNVAPRGTMAYTISPSARNDSSFILFASNEAGYSVSAFLRIILTCPNTWFFAPAPAICPAMPALISYGAEQHFERGTMLWVQAQELIYVLFDDDQGYAWYPYGDDWEEGMPEFDPTIVPPPGYYQPIRGFGLVWREQMGVRDRLGWAVDLEAAYETAVQSTSASYSDTYIRAADGNVWRLRPEFSGWEKVIVTP